MPSWLLESVIVKGNLSTISNSSAGSTSSSAATLMTSNTPETSLFPGEQLWKLVQNDDYPNYITAPNRRPENTHPKHDRSITLANYRLRIYNPSCSTFLDLVDDPGDRQTLRLRAETRNLRPVPRDPTGLFRELSSDLSTALYEMYQVPPITYWPNAQNIDNPDEQLDAIYRIINPLSHLGNVKRTSNKRSMVYVTGDSTQPKALIFISFDPSIQLAGLEKWTHSQLSIKKAYEGTYINHASVSHQQNRTPAISEVGVEQNNWLREEPAIYQDINIRYHFGLDRGPPRVGEGIKSENKAGPGREPKQSELGREPPKPRRSARLRAKRQKTSVIS